jgi:hypothetical protein
LVGVAVYVVFGGGGETKQQRVEVLDDVPVLLVDRAVRLVNDDEVEIAGAESTASPSVWSIKPIIVG